MMPFLLDPPYPHFPCLSLGGTCSIAVVDCAALLEHSSNDLWKWQKCHTLHLCSSKKRLLSGEPFIWQVITVEQEQEEAITVATPTTAGMTSLSLCHCLPLLPFMSLFISLFWLCSFPCTVRPPYLSAFRHLTSTLVCKAHVLVLGLEN